MDHSILSTSIAKYMLRTNYSKQPSIKIYNNWIKDSNTSISDINTCIWCLNLIERLSMVSKKALEKAAL